MPQRWLIVGASRGLGIEFVSQLLLRGDIVIATVRAPSATAPPQETGDASRLWSLTGGPNGSNLSILECDLDNESSIRAFREEVWKLGRMGRVLEKGVIDCAVINPGRLTCLEQISEITFSAFTYLLHNIVVGPLVTAQHLLSLSSPPNFYNPGRFIGSISTALIQIRTLVFLDSDFGLAKYPSILQGGCAAYATCRAALIQGLKHLAVEKHQKTLREGLKIPIVLVIHPIEVPTAETFLRDNQEERMPSIISAQESTRSMLRIIKEKGCGGVDEGGWMTAEKEGKTVQNGEASFWTWEGKRKWW
ncbi:CsgA protein [Blumeria hordei DH14]|uniref:CsgA protein n=1 Tax=Blumeria graminis f. sp. hordei (strain DH14) TaxID=546991 RepID=N1J4M9_BLUG1|nr:CsgA protein [Blumeria hordei DH14]